MKYLILSDLHIGDGTAKDDFEYDEELSNLLDSYKSKDTVLVLNGDILEIVETKRVKEHGLKPFFKLVEDLEPEVIEDIVKNHEKVFKSFRDFSKISKIIYVVGNHDYYLLKNERLKEKLLEFVDNVEIVPFYYINEIATLIMHGNQFDVLNRFVLDKKTGEIIPPLGDFIARYMMVNFDEYIESFVPKDVIKDYDNVRPLLDVFNWFEHVTEIYHLSENLVELWVKNFLQVMRTATAKQWLKKNYPVLRFYSKLFLNKLGGMKLGEAMIRFVMKFRGLRRTNYLLKISKKILTGKKRLSKEFFVGYDSIEPPLNATLKGLILGHIHHAEFEFFQKDNDVRFYLNAGTWRPVVERTKNIKNGFQKKAILSFAIVDIKDGDLDISLHTTNKLEKISIP